MKKQKVFITGATGTMGSESLKRMVKDLDKQDIIILSLNTEKDRKVLKDYMNVSGITIHYGDLTNYDDVYECVKDADIVLHIGALVSPAADYYPKKAMQVNYLSTKNIIDAIKEQHREDKVKLVYIGTVAETGDRMPPIHWGRVGDPIKPSMFDYYAVSKIAAERLVIESGLKYWVSLRQTGIIGPAMSKIKDAIMFHNCLDCAFEYVSDRDSGRMMKNLCRFEADNELPESFWCHIYNIGGGEKCRIVTIDMYKKMYGEMGITNLKDVVQPKWYATRNFHGQYYLDSGKLENYLHFRNDGIEYYFDSFLNSMGGAVKASKVLCRLPGGQKLMGSIIKKTFKKLALADHGTIHFIDDNVEDHIDAFWGSRQAWSEIPDSLTNVKFFKDWDKKIWIDHGYDETKAESELDINDVKGAAEFRGGKCLSNQMEKGNWAQKLKFKCAFGHEFMASPRLVLEGGHWCPECERKSWNYSQRAKKDKFFAQVWDPLHGKQEVREYPKLVSELDV